MNLFYEAKDCNFLFYLIFKEFYKLIDSTELFTDFLILLISAFLRRNLRSKAGKRTLDGRSFGECFLEHQTINDIQNPVLKNSTTKYNIKNKI